jgi:hypothetical protein
VDPTLEVSQESRQLAVILDWHAMCAKVGQGWPRLAKVGQGGLGGESQGDCGASFPREEANFQQPTAPVSFPCAKREAGWGLVPNSKNKRGLGRTCRCRVAVTTYTYDHSDAGLNVTRVAQERRACWLTESR